MSKFYIKKLIISGENKTPSSVEFGAGLNIIHGVSDTGKTCIVNCIDFVFGSKNNTPIPETHGYSSIQLLIKTDSGDIYKEYILKDIDETYSYMLRCGATSFWETIKGESDFGGAGSLCHGWSALPVYFYTKLLTHTV